MLIESYEWFLAHRHELESANRSHHQSPFVQGSSASSNGCRRTRMIARSTVVNGAGPAIEGRRRGRDEGASYTSSLVNPDRRPGTAVRDVAEPVEGDRTGLQTETTAAAAPRRRLRLPTGARSRPLLIGAGLLALLALPLIVALVVLAQKRWYPMLDLAMTELRVRDVAGQPPAADRPARAHRHLPRQGSHPGPLSFWALCAGLPPVRLVVVGDAGVGGRVATSSRWEPALWIAVAGAAASG